MRNNQKSCPICGKPMSRQSPRCRQCWRDDPTWKARASETRKGRPSYERTPEIRARLSQSLAGKKKKYPSASTRPDVAAKIQAWWTPERRQAKRDEMLERNPAARYHGLSAKGADRLKAALGHCERCGHDGSESRLDVHHRNGNKQDQSPGNPVVLCHRCHMAIHAEQGETGFDRMWQKRKMSLN